MKRREVMKRRWVTCLRCHGTGDHFPWDGTRCRKCKGAKGKWKRTW